MIVVQGLVRLAKSTRRNSERERSRILHRKSTVETDLPLAKRGLQTTTCKFFAPDEEANRWGVEKHTLGLRASRLSRRHTWKQFASGDSRFSCES
jgi:hypothetical protein